MKITKKYINELSYEVIGAAIEVHKHIGPGLLEKVYQKCLVHELASRKIKVESELIVPIVYKRLDLDAQLRCDLYVEGILPVELKSVKEFIPLDTAQILSYMNLLNAPKGILINFNVTNIFREGQKTFVNQLFTELPER